MLLLKFFLSVYSLLVWLVCVLKCFSLGLSCMGLFVTFGLDWLFRFHVGEISNYNLLKKILIPFLFLFLWDLYIRMLVCLILSQRSLRLSSVIFILFKASRLHSFFLLISALLSLVQWFVEALHRVRFVLSVCLFVFSLMVKAQWGGNPVCWWLGLYFCFVGCLYEVFCIGCYWWFGYSGSCIQLVSFVWVFTICYSLGLVLTMPKPLTVWITINWKILKEMGIPDHLTCLLRNLYSNS